MRHTVKPRLLSNRAWSPGVRLAITLALTGGYLLGFVPLHHVLGVGAPALSALPVIVAAWFFGLWGGLAAALLALPLNTLLLNQAGQPGWDVLLRSVGGSFGSLLVVVVGGVVGGLRDLQRKIRQELIERDQVECALRQRQRELNSLLENSLNLSSVLDLKELLGRIAHNALALLDADECVIFRLEADSQMLVPILALGEYAAQMMGNSLKVGQGITGSSVARKEPILVNNAQDDPRAKHVAGTPVNEQEHLMAAPIACRDVIFGALMVNRVAKQAFTEADLSLLTGYALQAAIALYNAQLYEQVQHHATGLEKRVAERTAELETAMQRLQELDQLKSKFVADVSHELRSPVAALGVFLTLLEAGGPDKHAIYLGMLKEQHARLVRLVEDILNLSRLDLGKARIAFEKVDLNQICKQVVDTYLPSAEAAGLRLVFESDGHLLPVWGEGSQLAQAITNLVVNAIKYTDTGEIQVRTTLDRRQKRACLLVRDTGIGFAPEDLPHLFERFYRGRRVSQLDIPGSGLGLAIVKEVVELHSGGVEIESEVGKGSTVRVWLPLVKPDSGN